MKSALHFQVNPEFTFNLNIQIKEQLKWLIGLEKVLPGDFLPPASQLADVLHVNRNTVNHVYSQLRDEGIVTIQKGRGTQVTKGAAVEELIKNRMEIFHILENTLKETQTKDMDLQDFAIACCAYTQLIHASHSKNTNILFIECKEHDHTFYKKEVEKYTQGKVTLLFLEDMKLDKEKAEKEISQYDFIITTLNHATEVKSLFNMTKKPILSIGAAAEISLLLDIAKVRPGSKVAFACLGKKGGQWMAQRVKEAGIAHFDSIAVGYNNNDEVKKAFESADQIYASSAVYDDLKRINPEKVTHFPLILEKSSENLLKEIRTSQ